MGELKKITFITAHNWQSKRLGGFHKFAEAACENGIETVFFSFPRPYYALFMKSELFNKKAIKSLQKGIDYTVGKSILHNITYVTLRLPNFFGKFLGDSIMNKLLCFSFVPFKKFAKKWLDGTDIFVFESADGIAFIDKLKKMYPNSKFVYRPSDVIMYDGSLPRFANLERNVLVKADLSVFVHPGYEGFYSARVPDFYNKVKFVTISNGVDIEPFEQKYPAPAPLQKSNTALYIGAWPVDWNLIFNCSVKLPDYNFVIVCPNKPSNDILAKLSEYKNVEYIPGIMPNKIPQWMTNCDVFIVPYDKKVRTNRGLGVTAKYYQAMAAQRPIIAYNEIQAVGDVGIPLSYTEEEFSAKLKAAMGTAPKKYDYNLEERRWSFVKAQFINTMKQLLN